MLHFIPGKSKQSYWHLKKCCNGFMFQVGFLVPRTSIYKDTFNKVMKRLVETGHITRFVIM